jgi:Rod binding domain-containing protein
MGTSIGLGSLNTQTSLLQSREESMVQGMKSSKAPTDSAKIDKGAQEFESVLIGSWLQQAEQSFGTVPGSDDDEDAAQRQQMMSFGVQSLATSLAASGGIGIGKMIAKAMHARADKTNGEAAAPPQPPASKIVHEKSNGVY